MNKKDIIKNIIAFVLGVCLLVWATIIIYSNSYSTYPYMHYAVMPEMIMGGILFYKSVSYFLK